MPGSAADPVVLDPMQTIVEVGWPARLIAIELRFKHEYHAKTVACTGGTTDAPPDPHAQGYLIDAQFDYNNSGGAAFNRAWLVHGTTSEAVDNSEVTASGLPSWPADSAQSFGDWQYAATSGTADGTDSGTDIDGASPGAQWATPAGSELAYNVPLNSQKFVSVTSLDMSLWGEPVTGAPICYLDSFSGLEFEYAAQGDPAPFAPKTFNASGISLTYKGKTFTCIGLQVIQSTSVPRIPGNLYLLFQRAS